MNNQVIFESSNVTSSKSFVAKVFLYIGLGLLITFGVAFGLGALFTQLIGLGSPDILTDLNVAAAKTYLIILVSAIILEIVSLIWITISFRRGRGSLVPYIIYTIVMGIFISAFTMFIDFWIIASSFGITSLVFGAMGLAAYLLGDKAKWFGIVGFGLLFGAIIVSLFNTIVWLITKDPATLQISSILSIVVLLAMLLITIFDFYRMNKIAASGQGNNNLALYCAFNLYVDFIYIFIRVLSLLASAKR